jgi:hypothetical protein
LKSVTHLLDEYTPLTFPAARRKIELLGGVMRLRVLLALGLLGWTIAFTRSTQGFAQEPASKAAVKTAQSAEYPDQGFLSTYRYANAYFGFSIDLPPDANLRPIPIDSPADGSVALLDLLGSSPHRSELAIRAYAPAEKRPDARLLLRHELDNELSIGVEELHGLTKTSIAGHPFFYFETRRGIDQHAIFATELDGYVIHIFTAGRDSKLLQQIESAVAHMRFFPPASVREYVGVGCEPYEGPAIPSHVVAQLKSDPPANELGAGRVSGNVYENKVLGLGYELPKGWNLGTEAAVMPAVERGREQKLGKPAIGANQKALLEACERTLVSAWRKVPQQSGEIAYDDFGEVTVSAMSLACFPNVRFPDLREGKDSLRDFLVAYSLGHPILSDMKGARAFERDGHTFIVMDGVVAYREDGDALSRRISVALALTKQRDYVVSFFFAAPHEADLRQLMNANAAFDPEPEVKQAKASPSTVTPNTSSELQPGGSVGTNSPATSKSSAPAVSESSQGAQNASMNASPAAPQSSTTAQAAQSDQAAPSEPFHPSLLKPGETMKDQQMSGAPVKKKVRQN